MIINILLLNKRFSLYGGIARSFVYLAEGAIGRAVRFHFGAFEPCDKELESELIHGNHRVVVFCTKKTGGFDVIFRLRKYIRENNIRLIYACCFRSYFLAKLADGFSHRVVFWGHSIRSLVITTPPKALKVLIFYMLLNNGWLVCNSLYSLQSYVRTGRSRSKIIYNGVKRLITVPKENARKSLGLPNEAKVLTYIAGYNFWKDHRTLIIAFRSLAKRWEEVFLILCGNLGSIKSDLIEPILGNTEFHKRLLLLSPRRDISSILSATDIYVHPCYMEGFGNIVVEAMRAKIPIVAANAGGLPEIVGDAGLLFQCRDHLSLEKAVNNLLNNSAECKRLAQKAKARAEQFSSLAFANRFLDTAEEILADLGDSFRG